MPTHKARPALAALLAASLCLVVAPALAQKGMGDEQGIARSGDRPALQQVAGTVTGIDVGACEASTGRSMTGAHLVLDSEGERLELHLGPLSAVDHVLEQTPVGTTLTAQAFRTDAMPAATWVAKDLVVDGKTIHLRDDSLRPSWAGGRGSAATGRGPGGKRGQPGARGGCWW
jgi:hypothetical protein